LDSSQFDEKEELNCYSKIIECFLKSGGDPLKRERCKHNSIIKVMNLMKVNGKKERARNSLIMILSLFNEDNSHPDLFTSLGNDFRTISNNVLKKELLDELEKELIS